MEDNGFNWTFYLKSLDGHLPTYNTWNDYLCSDRLL